MFRKYQERYVITQQPQAGLTEKLQWASRVSTAYRGDESRKSLRRNPEVTLTMTHRVAQRNEDDSTEVSPRTRIQALINAEKVGMRRIEWWCPLWHLSVHVTKFDPTLMDKDNTMIPHSMQLDTYNPVDGLIYLSYPMEHGFQEGATRHCIVYNPESIAEGTRTSYTLSGNELTIPTGLTFPLAIAVLREANLVGERGLAGMMGDDELTITYRLVEPLEVDTSTVPQFDGIDVLSIPSEEQNPDETDEQEQIVSFQTGKHDVIRRRDQPVSVHSLRWVGQWDGEDDRDNVAQFRRWLWKREGRTIAFLHPSFNDDLVINEVTASKITLFLSLDDFTFQHLNEVSPYIALVKLNAEGEEEWEYGEVTVIPNRKELTVSGFSAPTYRYGSFVFPMRLREDSVTFEWDNDRFVSANIGLQSFYTNKTDGVVKGTPA